jgi:glycine oxidase
MYTLRLPAFPESIQSLSPWTGVRPASADGAPFIGQLAGMPNVLVASGHGMIGTAMAMGTADLVARYLRGERISEAELALTPNR